MSVYLLKKQLGMINGNERGPGNLDGISNGQRLELKRVEIWDGPG